MSEELQLLGKLLTLYRKRYSGKKLETIFNAACDDLIDTGDISRGAYIKFCVDEDIEPTLKKRKSKSSSSSYSSGSDPCGSRSASRSSC